jgi:uncharacterized membrane protein YqhA
MRKALAGTRYLAVVGVIALLAASLIAYGWGVVKMIQAVGLIFSSLGQDAGIAIALIEIVDAFLVATAMLIFGLGLYELFVGELDLPAWIQIHDLRDLKVNLGGVLVLVMAVKFVEKLAEWKDARETLFFALAIAVVSAVLIAFGVLREKS